MERVGKFVDEPSDVLLVGRIDLLPIDHHARRFCIAQNRQHVADESFLPILRTVRQILDRFRLPRVAD